MGKSVLHEVFVRPEGMGAPPRPPQPLWRWWGSITHTAIFKGGTIGGGGDKMVTEERGLHRF
ncbi:hypothetical protein HanRHA438_Chr10g0465421 [Helianthus annuus]|nr:hypothetical protein HanRHA438_Chr10g0465421 [Helianthus annuus]